MQTKGQNWAVVFPPSDIAQCGLGSAEAGVWGMAVIYLQNKDGEGKETITQQSHMFCISVAEIKCAFLPYY